MIYPRKKLLLNPETEKELIRLASFVEYNPRPIMEIDLKGNILYENPSSKAALPNLKEKGLKHKYLADFKAIVKMLQRGQETVSREIKVDERWFRHFFYYAPDFKTIRIYGLDITAQKQAEKNLAQSELRYRSLFNKMSEAYCLNEIILNPKGQPVDYRFLDLNPAFERLIGMQRKDVIGKTIKQLLPNTNPTWIKDYGQVALTGNPLHLERYDKTMDKYYEVFVYKAAHLQFATLFLDITELKKVDEEKNNFISIMSHELRNPLTPILASAEILKLETKDRTIHQYANIIERQAKTMARLLNDLLDAARLSHKKILLDKEVVDLKTIVKHSVETTLPLIKEQQKKISVTLPKELLYLEADPVRLEQIIVNLINNAIKYTKKNGRIHLAVKKLKGTIEIRVKDNGIGISSKKISKIFDLFNQAHDQVMFNNSGLGIGLNITKHLVVLHQGTIKVKSKGKNKGAEFIVTLPAEPLAENVLPPPPTPVRKKTFHKRVLIIEDNKDFTKLLSQILSSLGCQVKVMYDGNGLLRTYRVFKPDVVLIDIGLPNTTGYEIAKKIRRQEERTRKKAKLVALTGYGQHKDKVLAHKAGFDYHLVKPVDINTLTKIL